MTRRSSIALVGVTTILSITTGTDAFGFHHHGKLDAGLDVRQEAAASSAGPPVAYTNLPTPAGAGLPTGPVVPTIGLATPTYNYSMPVFPSSTIQEPIATVCPGQPADSGVFLLQSDPTKTISATAVLANGAKTTFASTSAPALSAGKVDGSQGNARIAVDANGCQTLFAPRITAICSTIVSPMGIPEVTVTDCEQWVTFSSDTKICPTVFPPTLSTFIPLPTTTRNTILEAAPSVQPDIPAQPPPPIEASAPSQPSQPEPQPPVPAPDPEQFTQSAPDAQVTPVVPTVEVPASAISTDDVLGRSSITIDPSASTTEGPIPILSISVIPVPEEASTSADPNEPTSAEPSIPSPAATDVAANTIDTAQDLQRRQEQPASITSAILPMPTLPPAPNGDYTAPGTYYAAHWYDVARGGVPQRVRAVECELGGTQCTTYQERWSATSFLRTIVETKPVSYSGTVVVTDGPLTYTTTISIATFTTTTRYTYTPTVIKQRLLGQNDPAAATDVPSAAGGAAAAATPGVSAGVFAGQQQGQGGQQVSPGSGGGDQGFESTTTMTGTITVTNTVYEGVVTSVVGGGAAPASAPGTAAIGGGEVGPDGVRTIQLVSL